MVSGRLAGGRDAACKRTSLVYLGCLVHLHLQRLSCSLFFARPVQPPEQDRSGGAAGAISRRASLGHRAWPDTAVGRAAARQPARRRGGPAGGPAEGSSPSPRLQLNTMGSQAQPGSRPAGGSLLIATYCVTRGAPQLEHRLLALHMITDAAFIAAEHDTLEPGRPCFAATAPSLAACSQPAPSLVPASSFRRVVSGPKLPVALMQE